MCMIRGDTKSSFIFDRVEGMVKPQCPCIEKSRMSGANTEYGKARERMVKGVLAKLTPNRWGGV